MTPICLLLSSALIVAVLAVTASRIETAVSGAAVPTARLATAARCHHCDATNLQLLNKYRASNHKASLIWNPTLAGMAAAHSQYMYDTRILQHSNYGIAENIIYSYVKRFFSSDNLLRKLSSLTNIDIPTITLVVSRYNLHDESQVAKGIFDSWKNSPPHNSNMLGDTHKCIGIGIYGDGTLFYGSQLFSPDC